MVRPGHLNLITDVDGITIGNAADEKIRSGVTVIKCAEAFTASVDVRGGAPGVRETDTLGAENLVGRADAIVLSGGSVFGLAAADGVAKQLSAEDVGLKLGGAGLAIPIVPAAVLYDLQNGGDKNWGDTSPYSGLAQTACSKACNEFALGSAGAGYGAMAGIHKGGLGSASISLDDGAIIGAIVAVNPVGSVFMPDGKTFYARPWEIDGEFGGGAAATEHDTPSPFPAHSRLGPNSKPGQNTVIAVVATNLELTNAETKRVAMMAHDGIARAVRPAHTPFDGDVVFAISTARQPAQKKPDLARPVLVASVGAAAADCLARAIARGVYAAIA